MTISFHDNYESIDFPQFDDNWIICINSKEVICRIDAGSGFIVPNERLELERQIKKAFEGIFETIKKSSRMLT